MDYFLPFSLCSSLVLLIEHADGLKYAMCINHVPDLLHYLDDYFTTGSPAHPHVHAMWI